MAVSAHMQKKLAKTAQNDWCEGGRPQAAMRCNLFWFSSSSTCFTFTDPQRQESTGARTRVNSRHTDDCCTANCENHQSDASDRRHLKQTHNRQMKLLMSFTTVPLVRLIASIGIIFSGFGLLAIRYLST